MKIGITDYVTAPFEIERTVFPPEAEIVFLDAIEEDDFDAETLASLDALLVWHAHISKNTAKHLTNCKIVVRYGVGFDNIDVAALCKQGIPFCNTPDYGTEEVADTAAAMILNLSRKVTAYDRLAQSLSDTWQENTFSGMRRLSNSSLGVIGVGRIGSALLRRMRPFGLKLIGYDPYQPSGHEKALSYERTQGLTDALKQSDIVSLHCPLNDETDGLVDEQFLADMKPGAILVNTARGGLVKSLELVAEAILSGHLGGVALDVLPQEPPEQNAFIKAWRGQHPAFAEKVIVNPHTAYFSEDAWREMRVKAAETIVQYLENGHLRNRIMVNN